MKRIIVYDWKIGFDKVGFTKFLRAEFGYSLTVAKGFTDRLLEHEPVAIDIEEDRLEGIVSKLEELRAEFRLDHEGP
jgi:hypothetical protein